MTSAPPKPKPAQQKLAQALRENLLKRKQQTRARDKEK
jgi:hypothetical protein